MTRELILAPEAEAEIAEAASWYESHGRGLGPEFLRAVEAVLETVQRNPQQYQVIHRDLRRAPLRRFPFSLMYILSEREIMVLACIHGRRCPKHWKERMPWQMPPARVQPGRRTPQLATEVPLA
jgi:plasmid stabilization system protein ParE